MANRTTDVATLLASGAARLLALLAALLAGAGTAAAQTGAACYRVSVTTPTTFTLPGGAAAAGDFCRPAGGAWVALETDRQPGRAVTFTLGPALCSAAGEALVVLGKPAWMVLDDARPPRLTEATVDGAPRPVTGEALALGAVNGDRTEICLTLADDQNPLAAEGVTLRLTPEAGDAVQLDRSGLRAGERQGRVVVRLRGLRPGAYHGELAVSDQAPMANRARCSLEFSVFGVTIAEDRQSLVLVGGGAGYRLQPHLAEQLLLPGGIWAKLTTRTAGTWLYPRQFTEVTLVRDAPDEKTVLVKANTQGIEGKPNEGLGALEYELTVRTDTPALLVTTRSINTSGKDAENSASWGWLPAAHYVTPAGRQEWRGKAADRYIDVGRVGWLWLAPLRGAGAGLAWMSPQKFGESRFDTMLLYSEAGLCKPGECAEIRFAVAPADSPEAAAAIYRDLVDRSLLTPPPGAPGATPPP